MNTVRHIQKFEHHLLSATNSGAGDNILNKGATISALMEVTFGGEWRSQRFAVKES